MFTRNILVILFALLTFFACTGEDSWQMHEALMQAKAQNENFEPFTTDSTMLRVVDYYDAHGTANEQMLAHYLLGCVYRDLGDAPRALECYYDAVSKADTTSADCDFQRLSRIYGQMAELFHAQRSPQFEKEMWLEAKKNAHKCNDTISIISCSEQLAQTFYMIGQKDSSLRLANHAFNQYKKHGYNSHAVNILPIQISIYLERKDYKTAKSLFDKFEQHYLKNGNMIANNGLYYYYKGLYYWGIEKFDSAKFCYNKLLNSGHFISDIEAASKGLMEVYHKLGKPDSVMKYSLLFANANDSACLISSAEEINRANALYNYNASKRQAEISKREAEKYKTTIITGWLLTFAAICLICYIIIRYRRKTKQQFTELNNMYFDTLTKYNQSVKDLYMLQNDINKYRSQKEKETESLHQTLVAYTKDDSDKAKWNAEQYMLHCDIVNELHGLAERGMSASVTNWSALTGLTVQHLATFHQHLSAPQYALSEREIIVSILIKLRFTPSEMAILFDCSKQIITNTRTSINHKLFHQEGTKTLDYNLKSL